MPAPLSLRIKQRYVAKQAGGLSQQEAAEAVGDLGTQRPADLSELKPEGQQRRRHGMYFRTHSDLQAEV